MFGTFRVFSQSAQKSHFLRPLKLRQMNLRCRFHTTKPVAEIHSAVFLLLRPILNAVKSLVEKNLKNWMLTIPKDKHKHYWLKQQKWNILGRSILVSLIRIVKHMLYLFLLWRWSGVWQCTRLLALHFTIWDSADYRKGKVCFVFWKQNEATCWCSIETSIGIHLDYILLLFNNHLNEHLKTAIFQVCWANFTNELSVLHSSWARS